MKKILLLFIFLFLVLGLYFTIDSLVSVKQSSTKKIPRPTEVTTLDIREMNRFMRPVTEKDHIRGNVKAPVKIVEFADFECDFCKKLHQTMKEIIAESDKEGKAAWVYRHAFNDTAHKNARMAAEGSECVNELSGNDVFWQYTDQVFEKAQTSTGFDSSKISEIVREIGVDENAFDLCMKDRRYQVKVSQDLADAMIAGARGTPYVIVIGHNDKRYDFSGVQTKEFVKNLIDLAEKGK